MRSRHEQTTHLIKADLDILLLAVILEKERYGYELIGCLEAEGIRLEKEGSIYPLLRKMEKDGLLSSRLVPSQDGPARKYYRILPKGEEKLRLWRESYPEVAGMVSKVLDESP